ncbi:cbb3-type cytochrome c oxidase subunit II [Verrucomicrobiaceae bacterium N1E253]|uniref:Cbb3-type cytochrome c oxidase subunit II n=1 Tax=Oceaniferula marina TaxID=2748318 RepID=A0A851GDG9_9BACT|nr:cbb3-type cytochrome c oxidase subunit II [Oceaniferula marina]NWK55219.1 cbb3-type cytochrome c oxidase subunit II [Oceaniferula marina]
MTFKTFLIGMFASFGLAWTCIIAIPVASTDARPPVKMNDDEDAAYYQHGVAGRKLNGGEIYKANGCYTCHTQLVRPTYAGSEIHREGIAGVKNDDGDTRRETSYADFTGEDFAQIGLMRMGPDLSNFAYRAEAYGSKVGMTAEAWIFEHLYNPRNNEIRLGKHGEKLDMSWSNCPSQKQMFETVDAVGQDGVFALTADAGEGRVIRPKQDARVLASYLLSFKRDDKMPKSLDYSGKDEEE